MISRVEEAKYAPGASATLGGELIPMSDIQREHAAYQKAVDSVKYVLTKRNTEVFNEVVHSERIKGFAHNLPFLEPAPKFSGKKLDYPEYDSKAVIFSNDFARDAKAFENKCFEENNMNRFNHVGLQQVFFNYTDKELKDTFGAVTFEQKRSAAIKLSHEFMEIMVGTKDYYYGIMPHAYKQDKPLTDVHLFILRFDKNGQYLEHLYNFNDRHQYALAKMQERYPGLYQHKNLKTSVTDNQAALQRLTKTDIANVAKIINNQDFKTIGEFNHPEVRIEYIYKNTRKALDHENRKYGVVNTRIKECKIHYKGQSFTHKILGDIDAERKIRFMVENDKAFERKGIDLVDMRKHIQSTHANAKSYVEFAEQLLALGIEVQPKWSSNKGVFQGFEIGHKGDSKYYIPVSTFNIEITKHFNLDFSSQAEYNKLLNVSIKADAAYSEFSSNKLKLQKGETIEQWLARLKKHKRGYFSNLYREDGDSYYYGTSEHKAFSINAKEGTVILRNARERDIKALAEILMSRGVKELDVKQCKDKADLQLIMNIFSEYSIKLNGYMIKPENETALEAYKIQKAMSSHNNNLEAFKKQCVDKNNKVISIKPYLTKADEVFSYENVYVMLPFYAKQGVEIANLDTNYFIKHKDYLLKRFENDKETTAYLNNIFKIENMSVEEKQEYLIHKREIKTRRNKL